MPAPVRFDIHFGRDDGDEIVFLVIVDGEDVVVVGLTDLHLGIDDEGAGAHAERIVVRAGPLEDAYSALGLLRPCPKRPSSRDERQTAAGQQDQPMPVPMDHLLPPCRRRVIGCRSGVRSVNHEIRADQRRNQSLTWT